MTATGEPEVPEQLTAARAALARAAAAAESDDLSTVDGLESAADTLAAHAAWEDAMRAYNMLARVASIRGDTAAVRVLLSRAIGCAEAGGAQSLGAWLLHRLARAELRAGHAKRAGEHASHALTRLEGVLLLGARLTEAECMETIGDAHAALGNTVQAGACWRDAMARQEHLARHSAVNALRIKLDGLVA